MPADPAFPRLHGRPPQGWVNDPNGCCRIDGVYHVFFQHNPDEPGHRAICWGHATSRNLVHWQQEPVALINRDGELDAAGCWTGCVVDDAGVPTAVYSGVTDFSGRSNVLLARSDRALTTWAQQSVPVAGMPQDESITDVRDPFVFWFEGRRYAVQGAGARYGKARLLVYGCDDLQHWTGPATLLAADHPVAGQIAPAAIWECPNLFELGGGWVLIVSLWVCLDGKDILAGARYLIGDLGQTANGLRFEPETGGILDAGPAFYAPQVLLDGGGQAGPAGRVLLFAWSWELGRAQEAIDAAGWAGTLTFCRELALVDGRLVSQPVRELEQLRTAELSVVRHDPFRADAFDVELHPGAGLVTLSLLTGTEETQVGTWDVVPEPVAAPRIMVDGSIVEVFDGSGTAFTTRAYPAPGSWWVLRWTGSGSPRAWRLG